MIKLGNGSTKEELEPSKEFPYVCIDVETTGLDPDTNEIIEVAAIEFDKNGNVGRVFHQLCKPMSNYLPDIITKITGLKMEDLKYEPEYLRDSVREKVDYFVGDRELIGHNLIAFDIKFLRIEPVKMFDTLLKVRKMYKNGKNNLKSACKREGIEFNPDEAH
jgi:DNA polymerase III epsilon subunit-like protein